MAFTIVKETALDEMKMLYRMKEDNAYIVLDEYKEFSVIAQYSSLYDQVKIITVKTENLDKTKRLYEG